MKQKLKVINLYAGPGSGKSTTAAFIFYYFKSHNCNIEMVREYAKDVVYKGSYHELSNQVYITAKQYKKLKDIDSNIKENVSLVVTDSPLLLGKIYASEKSYFPEYSALLDKLNSEFDNVNVLIKRVKPYNPYGRLQTAEESDRITEKLAGILKFDYIIEGNQAGQTDLAKELYSKFGNSTQFIK